MTCDAWDPIQYEQFRDERSEPFWDLFALVRPKDRMRVIDLGCGTGELTAAMTGQLVDATVLGVDNSAAMLDQARARASRGLAFELRDVLTLQDFGDFDLIVSNAVLQWVPRHSELLRRIIRTARSGAQVAIQVPRNDHHPAHRLVAVLASEPPWRDKLGGFVRKTEALQAEEYSELLCNLGCHGDHVCMEKIYAHDLASTASVVQWLKGSLLTAYVSRLDAYDGKAFVAAYQTRLLSELGDRRPYHFTFRRLLLWTRVS